MLRIAPLVVVPALVLGSSLPARPAGATETTRVLIDADTANEVDDPYAIVRALIEPSLEVVGLASAQWQVSHWATPTTMEDSQRLNEFLLGHLDRTDLPHPRGAAARLYDWGQDLAGLRDWLDENGIGAIRLSYFGAIDPAEYGIRFAPVRTVEGMEGLTDEELCRLNPGWVAISATNALRMTEK